MSEVKLEDIVSLAKRRGFVYQGSEIYGGLSGTWDYGPLGVALKRKVMQLWWDHFVESRDDMYGVDAAILMNQKVWQASGHVDTFTDPLVECRECKARFRADKIDLSVACENCKKGPNFSEPRQFNMMFKTFVGPSGNEELLIGEHMEGPEDGRVQEGMKAITYDPNSVSYLRPETAQGIFTNFKNVVDSFYPDLPFGLAQQGKAFRNEISPRDFIFRSREFEQMEIEYFVHPERWQESFEMLLAETHAFLEKLGLQAEKIHELEVPEADRAHYSQRTIDIEFDFPIGREELMGIAYRTSFDLDNIARVSGKAMEYIVKGTNDRFVPHVIEPSFGVERAIMAVLSSSYREDEQNGEKRIYLALPEHLAPYKFCVSPLLKNKPELVEKAREVYATLKIKYGNVTWDDNGNIGKRYRRQDEIGTPSCIVIDFETLEDSAVTVRDRDTTQQRRVSIESL